MDKERKIGTPYLQDKDIINILAEFRGFSPKYYNYRESKSEEESDSLLEYQNEKITFEYRSLISRYEHEIITDANNLVSLIQKPLNEDWTTKDFEVKEAEVIRKYPYIKELSETFVETYQQVKRQLRRTKKVIDSNYYISDTKSYYNAIMELAHMTFVSDMWKRKIYHNMFHDTYNQEKPAKPYTIKVELTKGDIEGLDPEIIDVLLYYFEPKLILNSQDKNKVLRTILKTPTGKGRNSRTREILNSLQTFFKPKDTFNYIDGSTIFRNNKERAKIISDISFNSKPETIYRFFKEGEFKELSKPNE